MDGLLTLEQLKNRLKVDQKTIYNWRTTKGLPFIKIGRCVYFREESVNKWITSMEQQGASNHPTKGGESA